MYVKRHESRNVNYGKKKINVNEMNELQQCLSSLSLFVANQLSILEHAKLQLFMHPNIGGVRRNF